MSANDVLDSYAAVVREAEREGYPEGFPALPDLPVARYADPAFSELEKQHLWRKTWLNAGHISDLPKKGSYKLFEMLDQSIIISRGQNDEIRAYHNICRHRGSALLLEPKGEARRFLCPYHSWGYSLEGNLVSVPEARNFGCLEKSERGLIPVRCETAFGMIFINLDGNASPIEDFLAPVAKELAEAQIEKRVVKGTLSFDLECNWKTAIDNFIESYHLPTVHRDSLMPFLDPRSLAISLFRNGHARLYLGKKKGATIFTENMDAREDASETSKRLAVSLPLFPNTFVSLDPVNVLWQNYWPTGPNTMNYEVIMLGHEDGGENEQHWQSIKDFVAATAAEDLGLFAPMRKAVESGAMTGIVVGYQERAIYWYNEEIDRVIGVDNIPDKFRVTQVLEDHAQS